MNKEDCLLIENALCMHSKALTSQIYCCVVCTKDYFFVVPTKSVGMFVIFNTIQNHAFFEGKTIPEGLKGIIAEADSASDLEGKLTELLESNEDYIYKLSEAKSLKMKSFLGKKTLMYRKGKGYASFNPKSKDEGKALVEFYPNI